MKVIKISENITASLVFYKLTFRILSINSFYFKSYSCVNRWLHIIQSKVSDHLFYKSFLLYKAYIFTK